MANAFRRRAAGIAVLVVAAAAVVVWWPEPSDIDRTPTRVDSDPAHQPSPAEPKARRSRAREETPLPAADSEAPAPFTGDKENHVPATRYVLTVTVLRSDGTPAPDAVVVLLGPNDDGYPSASGRTDANGVAVLRAGVDSVRVVAWLGSEAGTSQDFLSPTVNDAVTVRLGPSVVVHGRVTMDGEPVWGADVKVTAEPWFQNRFGLVLTARTNAAGEFRSSPIPETGIDPASPLSVEARTADLSAGHALAELAVLRRGGETVVELHPAFTVRARFVDADRNPVSRVIVRPPDGDLFSTSEGDGRISLRLPWATSTRLVARWPTELTCLAGYAGPDVPGDDGSHWAIWYVAHSLGSIVPSGGDVDLGDIAIAMELPVKGVVIGQSGQPMVHANVSLYLDGVRIATTGTDDAGAFVLAEVGADPHSVVVRERLPEGSTGVGRLKVVEGVRGGDPDLRIVLDDAVAIVLRFLSEADRNPLPCANYSVRARVHGAGSGWLANQVAGRGGETCTFRVLRPGSYDVEIDVAGYEPQRFESVEVAASTPTVLDLLLRKKHE